MEYDKFGNVVDKAAAERAALQELREKARAARAAKVRELRKATLGSERGLRMRSLCVCVVPLLLVGEVRELGAATLKRTSGWDLDCSASGFVVVATAGEVRELGKATLAREQAGGMRIVLVCLVLLLFPWSAS